MIKSSLTPFSWAGLLVAALAMAVRAESVPVVEVEPLHAAMDEAIEVMVDEVVIRDEYRIRIKAHSGGVQVKEVALLDARGNRVPARGAPLPASIAQGDEKGFTFFFPITPRPRGAEVTYVDAKGEHRLALDTHITLAKVHVDPPPRLVDRTEPEFPIIAIRGGFTYGRVKARLSIAMNGTVDKVAILESNPPGIFDREAARTMTYWKYDEAMFGDRTAVEILEFKR